MGRSGIAIVNCGLGNIGSVANALEWLQEPYFLADRSADLVDADGIILPGVGAFAAAMQRLGDSGLLDELHNQVCGERKPVLGICIGMQILAKTSEEGGLHDGLGWLDASVVNLEPGEALRVPHVGWNNVSMTRSSRLFSGIEDGAHFYFDHSYRFVCDAGAVTTVCDYGGTFNASIEFGNIFATQFHPEKSQRNGLKLLRNFGAICRENR